MKNKLSWHCMVFMLLVGLTGLLASPVRADSNFYGFVSTLDGAQQVPPNGSPAKGTAKASYDPATNKLNLSIIVTGISPTSLTGAHIHLGPKGSSGAVIVSLGTTTWQATPTGMTLSASLTFPEANELDLINGNTYFNLHTTAFAGGEIRGQIIMAAKLVVINAYPSAASADGTTVVGGFINGQGFRWTPTGGVQGIGFPPNVANLFCDDYGCTQSAPARYVSADGRVIVGNAFTHQGTKDAWEAYRWTEAEGFLGLGDLSLYPNGNLVTGISGDGSTIIGKPYDTFFPAFRWTAPTGMVTVPELRLHAISGDGAVSIAQNVTDYMAWTTSTNQFVKLSPLIYGYVTSANVMTPDASIFAGVSTVDGGNSGKLVRWITGNNPLLAVELEGIANETQNWTFGISGDGNTIVGTVDRSTVQGADGFVWTSQKGKRLLIDILAERGVDVSAWRFSEINGISRDANTIFGMGSYLAPPGIIYYSGYIVYLNPAVTLPPPPPPFSADMSVTITDSPDPVKRLAKLTYSIVVKNSGPDAAASVNLSDTLPSNVTFLSAATTRGNCSGTSTVTCSLGDVASGASVNITIVVGTKTTGNLSNSASVTSTVPDPNTANNKATVTTTVN